MPIPEEFQWFADMALHVLEDIEAEEELSLHHSLIEDVQGFCAWRGMVDPDTHMHAVIIAQTHLQCESTQWGRYSH